MEEEIECPIRNQIELNEAAKYLIDSLEENMTLLANEADDPQRIPISEFWLTYGIGELRKTASLAKFPSRLQRFKAWIRSVIM